MRKKIIAGNWKMNMTPSEAVALVNELKPLVVNDDVDVVFCVPAIDIIPVVEAAKGTNIHLVLLRISGVVLIHSFRHPTDILGNDMPVCHTHQGPGVKT